MACGGSFARRGRGGRCGLGGVSLALALICAKALEALIKLDVALDQLSSPLVGGALLWRERLRARRALGSGSSEEFAESAIDALFEIGLLFEDAVEMVIAGSLEDIGPHTFDALPPSELFAQFGALLLEGGEVERALESEATGDISDQFAIFLDAVIPERGVLLEQLIAEFVHRDLVGLCVGLEHGVEVSVRTAVWDVGGAVGQKDLTVSLIEIFGGTHRQDKTIRMTDVFFELGFGETAVSVLAWEGGVEAAAVACGDAEYTGLSEDAPCKRTRETLRHHRDDTALPKGPKLFVELANAERLFPKRDGVVGEFGVFGVARAVIGDEKQERTGIVGVFLCESRQLFLEGGLGCRKQRCIRKIGVDQLGALDKEARLTTSVKQPTLRILALVEDGLIRFGILAVCGKDADLLG